MDVVNEQATSALVEHVTEATALRIRELLDAERATVYLVDRENGRLVSKIAHHTGPEPLEIRLPIGTGIAGKVAESGTPVNIADAYAHPDFNMEFDQANAQLGELGFSGKVFVTRSVLCMPIYNRKRAVIGVAQLLNKKTGGVFTSEDERVLQDFAGSLGIILETCAHLSSA
jgi:adenylate cyclase